MLYQTFCCDEKCPPFVFTLNSPYKRLDSVPTGGSGELCVFHLFGDGDSIWPCREDLFNRLITATTIFYVAASGGQ